MRRPRHTLTVLAIALPLLAEGLFLQRYAADAVSWHWSVHLCVGATLALTLMTWWAHRPRRPVRFPLLWILLAHLDAVVPDLLMPENVPHQSWQDIFARHVTSHPAGGASWLAIASLALGAWVRITHGAWRVGRIPLSEPLRGA